MVEGASEQSRGIGGITARTASWLAWSLCAISLVLTALSLWLLKLNLAHPGTPLYAPWLDNTLSALSYAPVGALVASRRPANPVGWLVCLYGFVIALSYFCAEYAIYALLARPGSLPVGEGMVWIASWVLPVIIGLSVYLLLLFPTGRLPSRRWRWLAWPTAAWMLLMVVTGAFSSGALLGILGPIRNPLGTEGLTGFYKALLLTGAAVLPVAGALSLFLRLRRAARVERQQIKWFAYAAAAFVSAGALAYIVPEMIDTPAWFERAGFVLNLVFVPAIPVSVGIAILRYRLYDIDIIINRTLVYGALTVLLAAGYVATIMAFQGIGSLVYQVPFRALIGQESALATVAATLAMAALFNPLRRRVQSFIDRRFYRSKYDAIKTLEAFSVKLRDETDLEALNKELVDVVSETMQPAHVSMWLRPFDDMGRRKGLPG